MLILQRKAAESLVINGNIHITIQEITADRVKIAIDAPREISIVRSELLEAASANQEATKTDIANLSALSGLIKKQYTEKLKSPQCRGFYYFSHFIMPILPNEQVYRFLFLSNVLPMTSMLYHYETLLFQFQKHNIQTPLLCYLYVDSMLT